MVNDASKNGWTSRVIITTVQPKFGELLRTSIPCRLGKVSNRLLKQSCIGIAWDL